MQLKFLLVLPFLMVSLALLGQNYTVYGQVKDAETQLALEGVLVSVSNTNQKTVTNQDGYFEINNLKAGEQSFQIELDAYESISQKVVLKDKMTNLGTISLKVADAAQAAPKEDVIPIVILSENELTEEDISNQNISGLLSASRDVFVTTAAFNLGAARFRIRGYDSENTSVLLNGLPMNDLENGRVFWSAWAGLNDVTRNQEISLGLNPTDFTFGGIGGATNIDTRASRQRRQFRVAYSSSNRTYTNRVMATYSTGLLNNGWAFSLSGSRRWAQEGYVEGTFYDAWSYFASVDKVFNKDHQLNFTFLGAPNKRGRQAAATQELYDLAGTNYYNPNWGFQNGEKRNSRVSNIHQPIAMLRYDWKISDQSNLTLATSYQFGRNGSTAIDWLDAKDPRPNYYQYLPSFARNRPQDSMEIASFLSENPEQLQVNWDEMYQANIYGPEVTTYDLEGNELITGKRSKYILEERRFDTEEVNANLIYKNELSSDLTLNGGLSLQYFKGKNYKVVEDLLGGAYYIDVDRFAIDRPSQINDINNPFRPIVEGDRFGYDYENKILKTGAWAQLKYALPRLELFLAANAENTQFQRFGNVANGKFPDNSAGASPKSDFLTYSVKGGLTYKIDGRNYLYANGMYMTRAPFARYSFASPRTRNEIVPNLVPEKITSAEIGYNYRSPYLKAKASAYYTTFEDGIFSRGFYFIQSIGASQGAGGFFNFVSTNVDKQHFGVELAVEARIVGGLSANAVASVGQYTYTDRQLVSAYADSGQSNEPPVTAYTTNFYIPGTPQTAYSAGLRYEGKGYWFASTNFNYFDDIWIDINPRRRAEDVVSNINAETRTTPEGKALLESIIFQEKAPSGYTLDFFGGKSFRIKNNYFLFLTVGVNNILNKQDIITGGYEQGRASFTEDGTNRFPNRYYYMFGANYFANATFRINI